MTILTAKDVAGILRVSPAYVYAMAKRGDIPCVMIGNRSVRFVREDIEEWVKNGGTNASNV